MHPARTRRFGSLTIRVVFARLVLILLPGILLFVGALRFQGEAAQVLLIGAAFQIVVCTLGLLTQSFWRHSIGPVILLLYGISFAWMQIGSENLDDWFAHVASAVLLIVPLAFFALQSLRDIGAPTLRKARLLANRLASRHDWPATLEGCKSLPEVKALREALHLDVAPALGLLSHARPQVQIAALAALEFRTDWRAGQAETVLELALRAEEPAVRAAALTALANLEDRSLVEQQAEFLRDPSPQVRMAATEALLWDTEHRWSWIRHAVRRSLGDPLCQDDGSLRLSGSLLTTEAVDDLTAWASEKGLLGMRAAFTLGTHYSQALNESPSPDLTESLRAQLANPHAPPVLRMELARLLQEHGLMETSLLQKLLDPANPAPLRLVAVEALLSEGDCLEARSALRELARLPNREIALATAEVLQRRLKVEVGLVSGQPLPPLHSKQATEVSRRVRAWATQYELGPAEIAEPMLAQEMGSWHSIGEN